MNVSLLANAEIAVPDKDLLINIVRLRVRELIRGSRPFILAPPGMGFCDIALSEIAAGHVTSEPSLSSGANPAQPAVITFPGPAPTRKAA